ncbi:MAG: ribose 5-phosphate isomerase B [Fimbriimonadaceae bacterium]|jgi:ribose 5-phosphate isomerase B|nr:ribose 5-phosphate isomerase B [Chthonomonadaceae bacterium]MCO5296014.1 ribose 5-phosphate isomerase B [Fimbriimonadaceae bacterium]
MKIVFGSDHAGFALREGVRAHAAALGHETWWVGAADETPYDYPDAADLVAEAILDGRADLGVLVCGTGIGISIRANRHPGIRAANCCTPQMAEMARRHNHANVLCLGGRLTSLEDGNLIFDEFLRTGEDREERHARRVEKLDGELPEAAQERSGIG